MSNPNPAHTISISDRYPELRVSHRNLACALGRHPNYLYQTIRALSVLGHRDTFRDIPETKERTSEVQGRHSIHRWLTEAQAQILVEHVSRRAETEAALRTLHNAFVAARPEEDPPEVLKARLHLQLDTIIRLQRKIGELTTEVERLKLRVKAARTEVMGEAHKPIATLGVPITGRYAQPGFFSYRLWAGYMPSRHVHGLKMLHEIGATETDGNPTPAGAPYAKMIAGAWSYDQSLLDLCREVVKETSQVKRAA
jgi:hypothetical protein